MRYTPSRGTWTDTSNHTCGHMHLHEFGKKKIWWLLFRILLHQRVFFIKSWKEGDKDSIADLQVWMLPLAPPRWTLPMQTGSESRVCVTSFSGYVWQPFQSVGLYVSVENEAKSRECDITTYDSLTVLWMRRIHRTVRHSCWHVGQNICLWKVQMFWKNKIWQPNRLTCQNIWTHNRSGES